jgi:hypothetical protein
MISTNTAVNQTAVKIVSKAINETRQVHITPDGNDAYLGGANVTTANGLKIQNNTTVIITIPPNEELWVVMGTGTHNVMTLTSYADLV